MNDAQSRKKARDARVRMRALREDALKAAARPTVKIEAVVDMEHLVLGQRVLVNGELCEVVEVVACGSW